MNYFPGRRCDPELAAPANRRALTTDDLTQMVDDAAEYAGQAHASAEHAAEVVAGVDESIIVVDAAVAQAETYAQSAQEAHEGANLSASEAGTQATNAGLSAASAASSAASVNRGQPNGTAPLDSAARLPDANIPSRLSSQAIDVTIQNKVGGIVSGDPAVADAVADRVLNTEGIVTGASADTLPPLPTDATIFELAFVDVDGKRAFVVDGVGTDRPRLRDAAVLYPSGDATGVKDRAAVNAALLAYSRVVLMPGQWYQNGAYVIPSNTHLHVEGPFDSRLVNGSNSNLLTNVIGTTTCANIAVTGRGQVVFDGNGSNQTRMDTSANGYAGWKNVGALFVNVDGLLVKDITIRRTTMFGALTTGVRNFAFQNVTIDQDHLSANQDGIDIGPACSYGWLIGTRGTTEDDVHSIFAKYSTSQNTVHPLYRKGAAAGMGGVDGALYSAAGNDTHHIFIHGSHVNAGKNFLRLQAAEGSKLYEIHATDLRHTGPTACRSLVIFGEMLPAYIDAPPASDGSDFHSITVDGFSGRVLSLVYLDSHVRNVTIRNAFLQLWGTILTQRDTTDPAPSARNMVIDGVTSPQGSVAGNNNLMTLTGGMVLIDCALKGVRVPSIDRVLANTSSAVQAIEIEAIVGEILSGAFFASAPVASTAAKVEIISRTAVADWGAVPTLAPGVSRISLGAS